MKWTAHAVACLALFICASARAQVSGIYVEFYSSLNPNDGWAAVAGYPNRHASEPGLASGSNLTISNANALTYRVFAVSPTTTDLGVVTINAASSSIQPVLLIGRWTGTNQTTPLATSRLDAAGARDVRRITRTIGRTRLQAYVHGNLGIAEDNPAVDMFEIVRLDVDGSIEAGVSHTPSGVTPTPAIGRIRAGALASSGTISAQNGNILDVEFVEANGMQGDAFGAVSAAQGSILRLVAAGSFGIEEQPAGVEARDGITELAAAEVFADIEVTGTSVPSPELVNLTVTGSFGGTFVGPRLRELTLGGDLSADITVTQLNFLDFWRVSGSITEDSTITLQNATGLVGRIVVNAADGAGDWDGDVTVGSTTVTGPTYVDTAPTFGGGSIGVAPFTVYNASCIPANGALITDIDVGSAIPNQGGFSAPVSYRHTGWIQFTGDAPVTIERRKWFDEEGWEDVTEFFLIERMGNSQTWLTFKPDLQDFDGFYSQYVYRVTPVTSGSGALLCQNVDGTPSVASSLYEISVVPTCPYDLDSNGSVGAGDMAMVLGAWGPCLDMPDPCIADIALSGTSRREVDAHDLANLLGAWGPCPGESMMMAGGGEGEGGGVPPVVAAFDFDSVEEYVEWVGSLSDEGFAAHVVEVLEFLAK